MHPSDRLILEIAQSGRTATDDEVQAIVGHVSSLGFDPAGLRAHYDKHVRTLREWPDGTSEASYVESIKRVILDDRSGVAIGHWWKSTLWHVTIMGRSGSLKGPGGHDWVAVEYRVGDDVWATAFQPRAGLGHVDAHWRRRGVRWLRPPR